MRKRTSQNPGCLREPNYIERGTIIMLPTPFEKELALLDKFFGPPFFNGTDNFPKVDIFVDNTTEDLNFDLALAGFNKDDIKVSFEDGKLLIIGRKEETKENKKYIQHKISYRNFDLSYIIPNQYNQAEPGARFEDGILNISFSKNPPIERKLIEIK